MPGGHLKHWAWSCATAATAATPQFIPDRKEHGAAEFAKLPTAAQGRNEEPAGSAGLSLAKQPSLSLGRLAQSDSAAGCRLQPARFPPCLMQPRLSKTLHVDVVLTSTRMPMDGSLGCIATVPSARSPGQWARHAGRYPPSARISKILQYDERNVVFRTDLLYGGLFFRMLAGTSAGIFTTYQTSIGMFRVCKHDGPIAATQPRDPPAPPPARGPRPWSSEPLTRPLAVPRSLTTKRRPKPACLTPVRANFLRLARQRRGEIVLFSTRDHNSSLVPLLARRPPGSLVVPQRAPAGPGS
ncbi:hypothetical protein VTN96DRAFT_5471 [Rasamsonia emersonii]